MNTDTSDAVPLGGPRFQTDPAGLYRRMRREHGAVTPVVLDGGVPAWLVLGDGAFDGWSEGRGLAVGADRLLVDEVTFAFDELAPATMRLGPSSTATDGWLEVPLTEGGSVRVRPRDPARFTEALRDFYRSWAVQQDSRPGR